MNPSFDSEDTQCPQYLAGEIAQEWDEIPFEGDEGKSKRAQLTGLVEQIIREDNNLIKNMLLLK